MSVGNEQITQLRALGQDKKAVTTTYTVRTGRPTDDFVVDNPIDLSSETTYTVTIPSGYKMGQTLLITCTVRTALYEANVSVTNHETSDPEIFYFDAVDEYLYLLWTGTEWVTVSNTCGTTTGL